MTPEQQRILERIAKSLERIETGIVYIAFYAALMLVFYRIGWIK